MEDPKGVVGHNTNNGKLNNIGGARNTTLRKGNGSTISYKITGNGPENHQKREESKSNLVREAAPNRETRIRTFLSTQRLDSWPYTKKTTPKPSSPISTYMTKETSMAGIGARRLLQQSNNISVSTNSTTTTSK